MPALPEISWVATDLDAIKDDAGLVVVFIPGTGKLDRLARRVNRLCKGALSRFVEGETFADMKQGEVRALAYPAGMAAETVLVVRLERNAKGAIARKAGAAVGRFLRGKSMLVLAGGQRHMEEFVLGAVLRAYSFTRHQTGEDAQKGAGSVRMMVSHPDAASAQAEVTTALAEGVWFARDLVNEPANVLTTAEFADRLVAMKKIGIKVSVLDESQLEKLGMRTLLAVGQGSESPSKVVVMEWKGGGKEPPLALVGKGVVFDTGGISLKPAGGMEDMTMDMGGAGTVAGTMRALALRKAKANVIGLVGLVENMPDAKAQRPGDVVKSMKGDTVEVINTDAEGRLVLCDVMWYAQEKYKPSAMIDLATLTGAVIVALGHENAGIYSNNDALAEDFLSAAKTEGEGAWRMPLGPGYVKQIKSRIADIKNTGGRPAGSVTAAEFLHRFVKDDVPWIHMDIAGVASLKTESPFAPKGATGWGVLSLNRLIADRYETAD